MVKKLSILFIVLLIAITIYLYISKSSNKNKVDINSIPTAAVKKGDLKIALAESGKINAVDQEILKSKVDGLSTIVFIVDEGSKVETGDLLVELDSSDLIERKIDQEIMVQNADANFISETEDFEVTKNQAQSDIEVAELDFRFAKEDLNQYIEGEYPNLLKAAQNKITIAREELIRAQDTFEASQKLYDENYISRTELQADELSEKRKSLDLELAINSLSLLENFTYARQIVQLESDVKQTEMALERTKRKAKANIKQAEAQLKAKEVSFEREKTKLRKIDEQIEFCKIYAPFDGIAIHATSMRPSWRSNAEPYQVGTQIREREELIYLPKSNASKVDLTIHEVYLEKIKTGMPATIQVDALPGKIFHGTLTYIAPLADASNRWMNPDVNVYNAEIVIDNNDESHQLKSGMSCNSEIIVEYLHDVMYLPVQAVVTKEGKTVVYTVENGKYISLPVETGLDNNVMIQIISGVQPDQVVLLAPPIDKKSKELTRPEIKPKDEKTETKEEQTETKPDAETMPETPGTKPS